MLAGALCAAATPPARAQAPAEERDADAEAAEQAKLYVELSQHEDQRIRAKAFEMLSGLGPRGRAALPRVLDALANDPEPGPRRMAARAASRIGAPAQVVGPLADALADADVGVRLDVAVELARLGPAAAPATEGLRACLDRKQAGPLQIGACRALGAIGPQARPALGDVIGVLKDAKRARLVREAAALAVAQIGAAHPEAVPALSEALSSEQSGLRVASARALTQLGAKAAKATPALVVALGARDALLRWRAAQALAAIGPAAAEALPQLSKVLAEDPGREIRAAAATALGQIGDPRATPALERRLQVQREHHTVLLAVEQALQAISQRQKR